jgi:hypothetical protein
MASVTGRSAPGARSYGGLEVSEAKRVKVPEEENRQHKKLMAER